MRKMFLAMLLLCTLFITACGVIEHPNYVHDFYPNEFESCEDFAFFNDVSELDLETVQYVKVQDYNAWRNNGKMRFEKLMLVNEKGKTLYSIRAGYSQDVDLVRKSCEQRLGVIIEPDFLKKLHEGFYAYLDPISADMLRKSKISVTPFLHYSNYVYSKIDGNWYAEDYITKEYGWSMLE